MKYYFSPLKFLRKVDLEITINRTHELHMEIRTYTPILSAYPPKGTGNSCGQINIKPSTDDGIENS